TSSILLPSIPTAPIPPVTQPDPTPIRLYSRRARIAQSSALPTVANEPASPVRDVSEWEACPTDSGFIADQDRATIAKSSTLPHDSAPRVTSPAADKGSMQHNISKLAALCTSLQRQYSELLAKFQAQEEEINKLMDMVEVLENKEDVVVTQSRDDAPIKGRSINEGEATAERISNDSEEVARVLTSMDAASVLAGGIDVPTDSGFIPTAGPPATVISTGSEVGPTASLIVTRKKAKEVTVESDTPKKKKLQEQIDAQAKEVMVESDTPKKKKLQEQIDAQIRYHLGKASVVANALSRNKQAKPLRVRALVMTINSNLPPQIHEAQLESLKIENFKDENLHGMDKESETRLDRTLRIRSMSCFFFFSSIAVQTSSSGISNLLAMATTFIGSGNLYYKWNDIGVLKDVYLRIFALETDRDVSLRSKLEAPNLAPSLRRRMRGGVEDSQLNALLETVGQVTLVPQVDRYNWSPNNVYSVICLMNYSNGENQVVSKSFAVTTADASDNCQQQQDSTLSTSTLATTITADGNFDL
nr:reverse transcriptase domain-containing protein [Tanacetum cinerariifolium]